MTACFYFFFLQKYATLHLKECVNVTSTLSEFQFVTKNLTLTRKAWRNDYLLVKQLRSIFIPLYVQLFFSIEAAKGKMLQSAYPKLSYMRQIQSVTLAEAANAARDHLAAFVSDMDASPVVAVCPGRKLAQKVLEEFRK